MARERSSNSQQPGEPELAVSREQLEGQLDERVDRGQDIERRAIQSDDELRIARAEYYSWDEFNKTLLRRSFSTPKVAEQDYNPPSPSIGFGDLPLSKEVEFFRDDVRRRVRELMSIQQQLVLYERQDRGKVKRDQQGGNTVFIVHGRDDAARQATERFLLDVTGVRPVVLRDQPNSGRTIIEKFEDETEAIGFAVVLLTGDDEGGVRGESARQRRARQNVVLELGFFLGALTRRRVAVLYEPGVELPSDMSGILYTEFDAKGAWRIGLGKELMAAGYKIDLNELL